MSLIAEIAAIAEAARRERDSRTVEDAARAAWHRGGPPIPELEALIRAHRETRKPA